MYKNSIMKKVGVLGGGIQGCCIALLLNKLNYDVTIIDQLDDIMSGASLNHEGKIHLGFVYAKDDTFQTGEKMMYSALYFSYYMEYLLEEQIDWNGMKSTKFQYLVPFDSLVTESEMEKYFNKLEILYKTILIENPHLSYLGEKPDKLFYKTEVPDSFDKTFFKACFQTEEVSISQNKLKIYIKNALERKGINLILNECIANINKSDNIFYVKTNNDIYKYDIVVNCLWDEY